MFFVTKITVCYNRVSIIIHYSTYLCITKDVSWDNQVIVSDVKSGYRGVAKYRLGCLFWCHSVNIMIELWKDFDSPLLTF